MCHVYKCVPLAFPFKMNDSMQRAACLPLAGAEIRPGFIPVRTQALRLIQSIEGAAEGPTGWCPAVQRILVFLKSLNLVCWPGPDWGRPHEGGEGRPAPLTDGHIRGALGLLLQIPIFPVPRVYQHRQTGA